MLDLSTKERLDRLRKLRKKADSTLSTLLVDHEQFEQKGNKHCYYRLPSNPRSEDKGPSVTPSCTAWMAFCVARSPLDNSKVTEALKKILKEPWDTGGLPLNNPFTVAILCRAIGFLVESEVLNKDFAANAVKEQHEMDPTEAEKFEAYQERSKELWLRCEGKSIKEIVVLFLSNPEQNIAIDPFPASPTICYWMVDAAAKLEIDIRGCFEDLATWAASEFWRQHSLISAKHLSIMDPIALVMAACLCRCIRRISKQLDGCPEVLNKILFPSNLELEAGVGAFFGFQSPRTGVWEKYFPIFHYPESGPNHCWHFEVLEAVIAEFPEILRDFDKVGGIDLSLDWLDDNRLQFPLNGKQYCGWNAGGDIAAMRRREPESWPTSVAHMFLARLTDQLSFQIRDTVLEKFGDRVQVRPSDKDVSPKYPEGEKWQKYMDADFKKATDCGLNESLNSVKKLVKQELLIPAEKIAGSVVPHRKIKGRHSAVLFGPPGTAKTSLCEAIAKRLGWYFIELSPSDFLGGGLEGIYKTVEEVFEDLLDLFGAVVLFDEMDALVQNRDGDGKDRKLDVTETLLTTSMLPKLAKLNKSRRVMYFMATNYIGTFDGAITRAGRFDLLVHMGPPSAEAKIEGLAVWCNDESEDEIEKAKAHLRVVLSDGDDMERFGRFTFGEAQKFFFTLRTSAKAETVSSGIQNTTKEQFVPILREWARSKITLSDGSDALGKFQADEKLVSVQ
ncbi:ATP-binding protein [Pirellulaceae bacterium SH501]